MAAGRVAATLLLTSLIPRCSKLLPTLLRLPTIVRQLVRVECICLRRNLLVSFLHDLDGHLDWSALRFLIAHICAVLAQIVLQILLRRQGIDIISLRRRLYLLF